MYSNHIIYYSPNLDISPYVSLFHQDGISFKKINTSSIEDLSSQKNINIILIDYGFLDSLSEEMATEVFSPSLSSIIILIDGDQKGGVNEKYLKDEKIFLCVRKHLSTNELLKAVRSGFLYLHLKSKCESLQYEIDLRATTLNDIKKIGLTEIEEQDRNKLLSLILSKGREITNCDAGTIYLLEETEGGKNKLAFKLVQNDSLPYLPNSDYTMASDRTSIAGYVAATGNFVNIVDAYNIPDEAEYVFNKDFDKKFNYRTRSMLVIPMKSNKGNIIGVLQLINRKRSLNVKLVSEEIVDAEVIPFDEKAVRLINLLPNQSLMSIGNNVWSQTIQKIFELSALNKTGIAFSTEQDFERLLSLILTKCKAITNSDAGSLYLMEETKNGESELIFKLVQNDSFPDLSYDDCTVACDETSIAGYVATTGNVVNILDVYNIPDEAEYVFNKDFDKKFNYRTRSMLVIPMKSNKGNIIGVLQLINRKRSLNVKLASEETVDAEVIPFDDNAIELINIVANQAALSIENNIWSQAIQKIFELSDLNKIGVALSAEQDYDQLLTLILTKCREISNCDAGTLYLLEETTDGEDFLVFQLAQNDSLPGLPYDDYTITCDKSSIAGFVATTGNIVNIVDAYNIPNEAEYVFNKDFDKKNNYRTKSLLTIPMKDHKNRTVGVLQLINRKKSLNTKLASREIFDTEVIPFDERSIEMLRSLSSQAAVSIENNLLYLRIQNLFEGFVKASILAIEQRDPATFGHSEKVATLAVGLARLVDNQTEGRFKDTYFTRDQLKELQYAAILHDFGKIGVRENVLVKAKKLYPHDLENIVSRFDFIKRSVECKHLQEKVNLLCNKDSNDYKKNISAIDKELDVALINMDNDLEYILKVNEPSILEEGASERIMQIASKSYLDCNNEECPYLTPQEIGYLLIKRGTLDEKERLEIELHSEKTYQILKQIPWTKELEQIPNTAYAHHEALNGDGYPLGLCDKQIPLQSKIIAIVDIYDALTAHERPYRKAVSHEIALEIINREIEDHHLDADLFNLFVKGKVYELIEGSGQT